MLMFQKEKKKKKHAITSHFPSNKNTQWSYAPALSFALTSVPFWLGCCVCVPSCSCCTWQLIKPTGNNCVFSGSPNDFIQPWLICTHHNSLSCNEYSTPNPLPPPPPLSLSLTHPHTVCILLDYTEESQETIDNKKHFLNQMDYTLLGVLNKTMQHCEEGVSKIISSKMLKLHIKKMAIKELCSHICETANDNTRFFIWERGFWGSDKRAMDRIFTPTSIWYCCCAPCTTEF